MPHQTPPSVPTDEMGCKCQGCGNLYRVDITVPDELWNRIKPEGKQEGAGLLCGHCIVSRIEALEEFAVLTAALTAQPGSGVPKGWRLVPEEPTLEMLEALDPCCDYQIGMDDNYRAMLDVAPEPPVEGSDRRRQP